MGQLTSRKGYPVTFGAPKDVREKGGSAAQGTIIDDVWVDASINESPPHIKPCHAGPECWGDYSFCVQLIKWGDGSHSIRLAYYRRRCGEDSWKYASQMTVTDDWRTIKTLLERTLAKTTWFQDNPV
jgi:hypothetical protein